MLDLVSLHPKTKVLTERSGNSDLHGDLRSWDDSVVWVGHEASIHSTGESVTWLVECRLSSGMILRMELKDDHVSDCSLDLVWSVDKSTGTTNNNLLEC